MKTWNMMMMIHKPIVPVTMTKATKTPIQIQKQHKEVV